MQEFVGPYVNHIGSDTHPNGTVFLLVTHKVGTGDFNAEIWRHDPPYLAKPRLVTTLSIAGPAGFGTVECVNDGSLLIYIGAGLVDEKRVGGNYHTLPGVAQPWTVSGTTQLLPIPAQSNGVDAIARSQAAAALEMAKQATQTARDAQDDAVKARKENAALRDQLAALKVPTEQNINDIAWEYAGRRLAHELDTANSPLLTRIGVIAQARLIQAVDYALSHKAPQSMLRALIETIIKGG